MDVTVPTDLAMDCAVNVAEDVGRLKSSGKPFTAQRVAGTITWVTRHSDGDTMDLSIDQALDLTTAATNQSPEVKELRQIIHSEADW